MNRIFVKGSLVVLALTASGCATKPSNEAVQMQHLEESRQTAQEFMQTLGGTLKKQLQTGGAESAIGVCKQIAPELAAEYSKDGRVVKRISLKTRNKVQGTPDAWEKESLKGFDNAQREGKPVDSIEASMVSNDADGRWFRYMKAIPTQTMCLQCHGKPADISTGVKAMLIKEYPEDKATGYSAGEIRGAISIKRKLDVVSK